jgi:O-acetyl-ADP-ribose deacetylase (regulator of RNase III)
MVERVGDVLEHIVPTVGFGHCVGADLRMLAGVALQVAERHGRPVLPPPVVGSVVMQLSADGVWLCHMVTKALTAGKPTYESLRTALGTALRELTSRGIKTIYLPRIGCGLDGLDWTIVRRIINEMGASYGVVPVVYTLPSSSTSSSSGAGA